MYLDGKQTIFFYISLYCVTKKYDAAGIYEHINVLEKLGTEQPLRELQMFVHVYQKQWTIFSILQNCGISHSFRAKFFF